MSGFTPKMGRCKAGEFLVRSDRSASSPESVLTISASGCPDQVDATVGSTEYGERDGEVADGGDVCRGGGGGGGGGCP